MANISDYVDETGNPKTPEPKPNEEAKELPSTEEPVEPKEELPKEYQGKSIKDVVRMHQEAVSLAGRHGDKLQHQEKRISDLQEALDTLILQNTPKEEEEVDYFSEPKKAMEQFITPKLKEIEEKLDRNEKLSAVQQLYAKHPDAADLVKSSEFHEWIQAESSRRYAFENAQSGNLSAADSLLSDFKRAKKPKQDRKSETQKASTGVTTASTAPTSRKIYKRRDIIDLMKKDPKRYESMAKEIRQAYAEGRVR